MSQAFCQQFWQHKLRGFLEVAAWHIPGLAVTSAEEVWQLLRCLEDKEMTDRSHALEPLIPAAIIDCPDVQKVFWWFWRCFPQAIANANHASTKSANTREHFGYVEPQITSNWDWSHASVAAALAGARAGHGLARSASQHSNHPTGRSRPHLALFKFTPVFDLTQTSQTMQEIWAGSWVSHYLAAKICWRIARKYGPDTFLSPCLYAHPWIDDWLLQRYPDFKQWIATPTPEAKLQSQFSNTLTMILPDNGANPNVAKHHPIWATMIYAEQTLKQEWLALSQQLITAFHTPQIEWQIGELKRKEQWLEAAWQPYWVALPIPDDRTSTSVSSTSTSVSSTSTSVSSTSTSVSSTSTSVSSTSVSSTSVSSTSTSVSSTSVSSAQSSPIQSSLVQQAHSCLQRLEHSKLWKLPTLFNCHATHSDVQPTATLEIQPEMNQDVHQTTHQTTHQTVHQNINQLIHHKLPLILPDLLALEPKELSHDIERSAPKWRVTVLVNWRQLAIEQRHDAPVIELIATAAFNRALLAFSEQHLPDLMQRHHAQGLWSTPGCILASLSLKNWQDWVWELQQAWKEFCVLDQPSPAKQLQRSSVMEVSLVMADATMPLPLVFNALRYNQTFEPPYNQSPRSQGQDLHTIHLDTPHLDTIQIQVLSKTHPPRCVTANFAAWNAWRSLFQSKPATLATCATAPAYLQFLQLLQQTSSPETFDQDVQNWLHLAVFHPPCDVL